MKLRNQYGTNGEGRAAGSIIRNTGKRDLGSREQHSTRFANTNKSFSPVVLVPDESLKACVQCEAEPLKILGFKCRNDKRVDLCEADNILGSYRFDEIITQFGPVVGIGSCVASSGPLVQRLAGDLGKLVGHRKLPVWISDKTEPDVPGFQNWLSSVRAGLFTEICTRNADVQRALVILRRDYDNMVTAFTSLEEFVDRVGLNTPELTFQWTADTQIDARRFEQATGAAPSAPFSLVQLLPVHSRGLARIDIDCVGVGHPNPGMVAELWTLEGARRLAQWKLPAAAFNGKKLRLQLDRACLGLPESVELRFIAEDPLALCCMALGKEHPAEDYCARLQPTDGGKSVHLPAPLAMTIWHAPPGLRLPNVASPISLTFGQTEPGFASPVVAKVVSADQMRNVEQITKLSRAPDFCPVSYWEEKQGILVHPFPDVVMVARMPDVIEEAAERVSILVRHEHGEGVPLECAAWLADRAVGSSGPDELLEQDKSIAFSGWTTVAAGGRVRLNIVLGAEGTKGRRLYLATRVPAGSANTLAWAIFKRIDYVGPLGVME